MVFLVIFGIVMALGAFIWIKDKVWDNPQSQISLLKSENERIKSSTKKEFERIQNLHKDEVSALEHRLRNSDSLQIQGQEFADIVASFYWEELSELYNKEFVSWGIPKEHSNLGNTKESVKLRFREAVLDQYKYRYYWSSKKQIHENHIHQLSGTINSYCFEHNCDSSKVKGLLVTNIELTEKARKIASYLNIRYVENFETGEFPRIKCNIGRDDNGEPTKIYHLPFDQQYDSTKIEKDGEFFAWTVSEAEEAGFRRAFKWFGTQ